LIDPKYLNFQTILGLIEETFMKKNYVIIAIVSTLIVFAIILSSAPAISLVSNPAIKSASIKNVISLISNPQEPVISLMSRVIIYKKTGDNQTQLGNRRSPLVTIPSLNKKR